MVMATMDKYAMRSEDMKDEAKHKIDEKTKGMPKEKKEREYPMSYRHLLKNMLTLMSMAAPISKAMPMPSSPLR